MTIYGDYSRARLGNFFGLNGWQFGTVALSCLPVFWAVQRQDWNHALMLLVLWAGTAVLVAIPVRGRSATSWLWSLLRFTIGGALKRTAFRSRASLGQMAKPTDPDLPGVLSALEIHDGPPTGPAAQRPALIQNHATRSWSVAAAVVHPGIGLADPDERDRFGTGLTELIDLCARGELVDEVLLLVRTVPDDGAERGQWIAAHRRFNSPTLARRINTDLHEALSRASVRTECFVTVTVPDGRLSREAREAGGGVSGRARVLYLLMAEVEAHLRGALGMTSVDWLTSPQLAAACRTGFAPGDRAGIIDALACRSDDPGVEADVPWALAGPSGADTLVRHYSHDAWNSVSDTIKLPSNGALMGALAPMLTPTEPGERRSMLVAFPITSQSAAHRQSASSEWSADLGDALREKAKVKQRAQSRDDGDKVRALDRKLARGNTLTCPYAVCTVTVPKTMRIGEFGRRLDSSIRRAGFAPQRLDLAQDRAFAASAVPLGVSLTRGAS